jgi:hypothetical protein
MRKKGVKVGYAADEPPFNANDVFDYLLRPDPNSAGSYCFIFRGTAVSNDAHAIGAVKGQHPYLMDPNIGEAHFGTRRDARVFFREHFKTYQQAGFSKALCYNCSS